MKLLAGKIKEITLNEENEEEIDIIELTYGIKVTINFFDNNIDSNDDNHNNKQYDNDMANIIPKVIVTIVILIFGMPVLWILYKCIEFLNSLLKEL